MTTAQLLGAGVGKDGIRHRVQQGRLVPLYRGVYQVGPLAAPLAREQAALLACGEGAALSHHTAAALWGIRDAGSAEVHVTVTRPGIKSRPGLRVHQAHSLDAAVHHGLRLTTPARTLLDVATHLPQHELDRAVEQAIVHRLTTTNELAAARGRGAAALREALKQEPTLTRSEAERRLRDLIRAARLPQPETNVRVAGWEVDLLWRDRKLVVEVDGYAFHGTRHAFERDRRKDADLVAAGYRVVRFTWRQLTAEPFAVVARLATMVT